MASDQGQYLEPVKKKPKIRPNDLKNDNGNITTDTRPMCKYSVRCFKSSSQHKKEFQHPESLENNSVERCHARDQEPRHANSDKGLPLCPKGVDCEETELIHFAEFRHPVTEESKENSDNENGSYSVKEQDECDEVELSEGYQSCEATQEVMDDYEDKPDEEDGINNTLSSSSIPRDDTVLSRGTSILRCYSILTEDERKELIRRAFELKDMLKKELNDTHKIIAEKNKMLKRVHSQLEKTSKIEGEIEALEKDEMVYFPLFAEREYKEGSAAQIHFRLAESQFYRLVDTANKYRVTKVDYIVNPILLRMFKKAQDNLKQMRGESDSYPVLAFHGTKEENIHSIAQTGFRLPGDANFEHATDSGNYGRGVYFSEYPSYSMTYIKGASKLLLCQVLPGKAYRCMHLIDGEPLQTGYDSHTSPDGKELVIFKSHHILPSYVVYYGEAKGDFSYQNE
ncbi:uncharacterized protein LOC116302161 [Actinia tenebrosa]|uniref:Poly [ADP-ribose] polymerase n=1 Tax=Actinia tenebrosa TaxID=6105 RepID=A0A6P8ILF0_ACTTE|nr:uncharacterized protein LOC116302161 [Actinia tenebrosa]